MIKEKFVIIKNHFASWTKFQIWLGIVFVVVLLAGGASAVYNSRYSKNTAPNTEVNSSETNLSDATNGNVAPTDQPNPSLPNSSSSSRSSSTQGSSNYSTSSGNGSNGSSGSNSDIPSDNSPSPESLSATVAFYADSQTDDSTDEQVHQRAVNYILGTSANSVFHAGDLMENGTQASLDSFNAVTATLRGSRSFYSAIGNNERNSSLYFNNFSYPNNEKWYSVNSGNLHMVILDSVYSASDPSQLSWLQSDLQSAASKDRITGVIYHYPTYSSTIGSILEGKNVDFVVAGHNHSYAHSTSGGVHYFVCSGQQSIGYLLAKVYSSYALIYAYNSSNVLVETIGIPNR